MSIRSSGQSLRASRRVVGHTKFRGAPRSESREIDGEDGSVDEARDSRVGEAMERQSPL